MTVLAKRPRRIQLKERQVLKQVSRTNRGGRENGYDERYCRHCFGAGDLNGVLSDYAPNAVLFTPDGPLRGVNAIKPFFQAFFAEFAFVKDVASGAASLEIAPAHGLTQAQRTR
jgi:hypothetical protein